MNDVDIFGFWELGWNTPIKEADLWEYALKEYGVHRIHMSPVSGILNNYFEEHDRPDAYLDRKRGDGHTIVFVTERADRYLPDFAHPDRVVYVFGKSGYDPTPSLRKEGDQAVCIPTVTNCGGFWPHQSAGIVLYDRMVKSWQ